MWRLKLLGTSANVTPRTEGETVAGRMRNYGAGSKASIKHGCRLLHSRPTVNIPLDPLSRKLRATKGHQFHLKAASRQQDFPGEVGDRGGGGLVGPLHRPRLSLK